MVLIPGRGRTDDVIARVARQRAAEGVHLAGVVRDHPVKAGAHPCDMDLRGLADGPVFRISQRLGPEARGCRLDGEVMETIAALVGRACPAPSLAAEAGIPTLVGVNQSTPPTSWRLPVAWPSPCRPIRRAFAPGSRTSRHRG